MPTPFRDAIARVDRAKPKLPFVSNVSGYLNILPRTIPLLGELYDMLVLREEIRDQRRPECTRVFER